jgi:hypothetical protein
MLIAWCALHVGAAAAGSADPARLDQSLLQRMRDEYRAEQLRYFQKSLNWCRDAAERAKLLETEQARERLVLVTSIERYYLEWIENLGGKPDPSAGLPTARDDEIMHELRRDIERRRGEVIYKALFATRDQIKRLEASADHPDKSRRLNLLRTREAAYVSVLQDRIGHPVMPVVPRRLPRVVD